MTTVKRSPLRILLSAYACEPGKGSEPGVGWNWAVSLSRKGHDVQLVTRLNNKGVIEAALSQLKPDDRPSVLYHDVPWALSLKRLPMGIYLYYYIWQKSLPKLLDTVGVLDRDIVHHLTFGSWRHPTRLTSQSKLLIFGPVGGGETAPLSLIRTMSLKGQLFEAMRYVMNLVALINPSLKRMNQAGSLIVSKTVETADWLKRAGFKPVISLEIGAPSIIPDERDRNPKPPGAIRCLFVGRLIEWKGAHLAIEAVASAIQAGSNVSFTIVGSGSSKTRLKKLIESLGQGANIQLAGQLSRDDLGKLYRSHDILLFPSMHDSSGNVVLEAMAKSLPVVCLDLGGPGSIVNSSCGIVVTTKSRSSSEAIGSLARAISWLATDETSYSRLSKGATERAKDLTWDRAVDRVYDLAQKVLAQR